MDTPDPTLDPSADGGTLAASLYSEMRRLARRERFRVNGGHTLQTTALISEAWLKLKRSGGFKDRTHYLHTAAKVMRQVLLDGAKARVAAKRGSGQASLPLDQLIETPDLPDETLLQLDDALNELGQLEPRLMQLVEYRFYGGYSEAETAELMGLSERTVRRDWLRAKAWLYRAITD
ncbi:MAG: ECF-type sigma factor [Pseudomonadota bacterium]|nr:ECF-type sigma factor [Pseudomonadota bacterium]